jgi:hypothetical protein
MSMTDDEDRAGHCTPLGRVSNTDQNRQRGQVDGRLILGAVVVTGLAGPLATAAVDIQSSLVAVTGFSWLTATVVALLIVAAMVAAVLEGA